MYLVTAFGVVLRRLRNEKGMSQEELANISGFHRTYLSLLERGLKTPSLETLRKISQGLEIPMHQFVFMLEEEIIKSNHGYTGEPE
jgi:transcriptional regulator with XRE-family HTH domain